MLSRSRKATGGITRAWAQWMLGKRVRRLRRRGEPISLIIGAGPTSHPGWLVTDLPCLDALRAKDWRAIFEPGDIDRIMAEHVMEHWTTEEFGHFLQVVKPYLSPYGRIRIAVPDGFHPDPGYIEWVKPGGTGPGADDHKVLYTFHTITALLAGEGYNVDLLEYWAESGQFHHASWSAQDGFIMRSADNDPRNKEKPLSYTSLIVDALPR